MRVAVFYQAEMIAVVASVDNVDLPGAEALVENSALAGGTNPSGLPVTRDEVAEAQASLHSFARRARVCEGDSAAQRA